MIHFKEHYYQNDNYITRVVFEKISSSSAIQTAKLSHVELPSETHFEDHPEIDNGSK